MCIETRNTSVVKTAALLGCAFLLNLIAASPGWADRITARELAESCDALLAAHDSQGGSLCRAFVHGYLMGAGKWANGIEASGAEDEEDFTERAMETRINPDLLEQVEAPAAEFCLLESTGLADVAQVVAGELGSDAETAAAPDARVDAMAIRRALAAEFPCDD